jgi:hypothetical protein
VSPSGERVDAVLGRLGLAARLRAPARRDSEQYDADALVDRVLDVYRDALARRGAEVFVPREVTAGTSGIPEHPAQVG